MIIYRFINKGSHRIIHRYHLSSSSICRMRIDRNEFAGGRRQLSTSYGKSKSNTNSICRMRIDRNEFAGGRRQLSTSYGKSKSNTNEDGGMYIVKAGLPLFLFCFLGVFVVSSGIEGKNAERDAFQGRISKCVEKRNSNTLKKHSNYLTLNLFFGGMFFSISTPFTTRNNTGQNARQ